MNCNELEINGIIYVPKEPNALKQNGSPYVIVRTEKAGAFAGYLGSRADQEATLINSRRLWYWDGAATLSQLSQEGTTKPENCKFPCEEPTKIVMGVIEVIQTTEKARKSIMSVPVWKK